MNGKRCSIFLVIFFLCALIIPSKVLSDTNFPLANIKIDPTSGVLKEPAITFQILPSLNDILSDCRIKPFKAYSTVQVDCSS